MPQMPGLVTGTALPQAGGKRHKKRKSTKQKGGFALAPILAGAAAVHAGLEKVKPFSRLNKALEDHVPDSKKGNLLYKIAHTITGLGKSIGYGQKKKKRRTTRKK
jgi:hypothetical protein